MDMMPHPWLIITVLPCTFNDFASAMVPDWIAFIGVPSLADMSVPEWDQPGLLLYTRCVPKSEVIRPSSGQMKGPENFLDGVVI